MNKIVQGDSLKVLKKLEDNSVDMICTDPPYGYSFMGKDWDKAVPSVKLWKECVRVLKPGGLCFVMSAPRADVQGEMIKRLDKSGFRTDFTPIYWTYASGFPKAANIGKLVDKRKGKKRKVIGKYKHPRSVEKGEEVDKNWGEASMTNTLEGYITQGDDKRTLRERLEITEPSSVEAKELDGSFGGYQPKPAVEVILVCMKPLSEKTYVEQALENGKGVTWLNDVRIPVSEGDVPVGGFGRMKIGMGKPGETQSMKKVKRKPRPGTTTWSSSGFDNESNDIAAANPEGRFPANLIIQDDVLNDGKNRKTTWISDKHANVRSGEFLGTFKHPGNQGYNDEGSYSRFFDLDRWWESRIGDLPQSVQATFPFMIVPKASKAEKNEGVTKDKFKKSIGHNRFDKCGTCGGYILQNQDRPSACKCKNPVRQDNVMEGNFHPTVKPIELMSYLVTLGSRKDDLVVDPFVGSGTTCIAAKLLGRNYMGVEKDEDYALIAIERVKSHQPKENQKASEFFTL